MHKLTRTIRTTILYITSVVLVGGVPMAAFADHTDICKAARHYSDMWEVDPTTNVCIEVYNGRGEFIGPEYMRPAPVVTPTPMASPDPTPANSTTVNDSGNGNTTGTATTTDANGNTTVDNTVDVSNGIQSTAGSGSAGVVGGETKGSATSGDASAQATVVNNVSSTVGDNTGVATFSYDINGNVVGDITINGNSGPVDVNNTTNINADTNVNNKTTLSNDVSLNATSGDATVEGNESQGNATSGSANTVANIINLINTIIAANQSFIGTINIYGNLNGDILMSPEFIPQLLAANSGSNSNTNVTNTNNLTLNANTSDNTNIVNNINLSANSGNASVTGNESNGSATTGTAQTNLTVLNLTGHQVTAANSLLVFVNVLGTWIGMIIDAPGSTSAAFGNNVTANNTTNVTANANLNNDATITNNVNLASQSGNAGVIGNESNGNATSGNATASANIANVSNSTFNLSGWFGILYINVFGSWNGWFGVNTAAGTVMPLSDTSGIAASANTNTAAPKVQLGFKPALSGNSQTQTSGVGAGSSDNTPASGLTAAESKLLAASPVARAAGLVKPVSVEPRVDGFTPILMATGFGIAGVSGGWMVVRRRNELRMAATTATQTTVASF
jgi:hypothetical protein